VDEEIWMGSSINLGRRCWLAREGEGAGDGCGAVRVA
jgi:hypothetical protein